MNKVRAFTAVIAASILAIGTSTLAAQKAETFVIGAADAGGVEIGMTIGEAKEIWNGFTFEKSSNAETGSLVAVRDGSSLVAELFVDEPGKLDQPGGVDEGLTIRAITIWDPRFSTKDGLKPGMKLSEADEIYRGIWQISRSQIEMREYANFRDQPESISVRVSAGSLPAGIEYKNDLRGVAVAEKFRPDAYVMNITLAQTERAWAHPEYSEATTRLPADCVEQDSEEGAHVSTVCKGPKNYRIHYFDSAFNLNFSADRTDGDFRAPITSTGLDFLSQAHEIHWRLADEKPFAVIMELGDSIIVRGLEGFEGMDKTLSSVGRYALENARNYADNAYLNITAPPIDLDFPADKQKLEIEGFLENPRDRARYVVKLDAGKRLRVNVKYIDSKVEGAVLTGAIISPNGEAEGSAGGPVFDERLTESGEYTIEVGQRLATDGRHIRFVLELELSVN